jgi:1-acyl-sn-glycerol-3-phosphate acyltransferase
MTLAYWVGRRIVVPFYFKCVEVVGQEHLPQTGAVILAPTHRSRWDAILVPFAAGYVATGRHLRFMVTVDEVVGLQGWLIRRMGGFAINTKRPQVASLRHGIEILQQKLPLVIFPEGGELLENRLFHPNKLHPGLARLALQAEASQAGLGVQVVPIAIRYRPVTVPWRCSVQVCIGQPLYVSHYSQGTVKQNARRLTTDLYNALHALDTGAEPNAQN